MDWTTYYMKLANDVSLKSKDKSTKVGALIVAPDNSIRSTGFNGFPRGVVDEKPIWEKVKSGGIKRALKNYIEKIMKRFERPLKYKYTAHAEQNAICQAAKSGTHTNGCTIYINSLPPCSTCARMIIQAGIIKVVYQCKKIPKRWEEDCAIALEMLEEAGVEIETAII